ncbi:hypothetical protein Q4E93_30370 [Flavitalea sp. BT771]|uniref:hypothetical protein n=1 Tax=Flavitalea sp. BT771 TaxID=3063329 RepID=UPI0026E1174D|nr:hypothetical protein [Flavitalea sp. BT771]MDO6434958.1 hypothetical protein [Flavitalea sp. BT771]MDV6223858.1 hypothetical protein [Flavitalea sp. BT771]
MKSNHVVKTLTAAAVAVVFFVSNPLASLANDGSKKEKLSDEQVSVQYIGSTADQVAFRVEFENPTAEKFWLIIKNDAGDVVYRKQFSDVHFSKSVYVQKEEADIRPTFVIRNNANEIVRQFAVTSTITESTVVTKL